MRRDLSITRTKMSCQQPLKLFNAVTRQNLDR